MRLRFVTRLVGREVAEKMSQMENPWIGVP
jgi:hypothetical protein